MPGRVSRKSKGMHSHQHRQGCAFTADADAKGEAVKADQAAIQSSQAAIEADLRVVPVRYRGKPHVGGQGVLLKTGLEHFEDALIEADRAAQAEGA